MSEEKLYAVKNDEGKYWDFRESGEFWEISCVFSSTTDSKEQAELVACEENGHVVTLIEEPEKVVLTKEQAEIIEGARYEDYPASYISEHTGEEEEELLMNAYVNGYTVAKEKRYLVHKGVGGKHLANVQFAQAYRSSAHSETLSWIITSWVLTNEYTNGSFLFTESEIEYYGLQDCEKEEVTDDEQ